MLHLCLMLLLSASVFSESQVRETETWMPMKTTQMVAMSTHPESSGDFGFTDDDDDDDDDYYTDPLYDDEDDEDSEFSGSGAGEATVSPGQDLQPTMKHPDINDNKIPEVPAPTRPTVDEVDIVQNSNEIPLRAEPKDDEAYPSNVLMSHAGDGGFFSKTEVLAALIAGCAVGLMFAVLLVLLLIYRMKKKDEGSYDLGKKPIYKKAPTTEIYA